MAFIINKDGEIVEGQALTAEEASILKEITEDLPAKSSTYIPSRNCQRFALHLLSQYTFTRRALPEVEPAPPIQPPAPGNVDHLDGNPTNNEIPNLAVDEGPLF